MRRRFNTRERVALFLAADGRCEECGTDLQPGWHGDHVHPHSKGGPTDVINGQALCPACNLKKGNRSMSNLREWQAQARSAFYSMGHRDFLVAATPGAGKTRFALTLARELLDARTAEKVVIVVPTDALRRQWADAGAELGLSLMPVSVPEDYDKAGYDGCVLTYAQVARGVGADLVRRLTRKPTLALLDEVHHAGENKSWGEGLTHALENAVFRLALTGTPWRRDNSSPIPFVNYTDAGKVIVDYAYEYGVAVADGVCRRIEFHAYDGEAQWVDCGKISRAELGADLKDDDVSAVLDAILKPDHSWMPALLEQAVRALEELRLEVPDAGGLVVAERQWMAEAYARKLKELTGEEPIIAVSDDPDAKNNIDRFRKGKTKWLVAVRMVSEGVDIPRLAVGVYAAKVRTPLFFRQVVGRFVRIREGEEFNARLFIPAIPALMAHAREIEEELRHQLDLEAERYEKAQAESRSNQQMLEFREPLSASPAVFDRAILGGDEVAPAEMDAATEWCRRNGIPTTFATNVARGLRENVPPVQVTGLVVAPTPPVEPRHRREKMLRGEVDSLAGKVAHKTGKEKREINAELLRRGFPPRAKASLEQLEQMREFLARWWGQS
ncbi:DEAD/DEAH box helicase family protein [Microtetraspora fusca]|uniref:DEAD/DEAH box helicase family protein n=1 Tax=Microtetraspora fusca TaxID=1997 RepID=A0ABW6VNL7_MICFU